MGIFSEITSYDNADIVIKLTLAMIFGMALGIERIRAHKTAGMRTYALTSVGAALFVIAGELVRLDFVSGALDPLRIASQIVVGVGFLGAGLIVVRDGAVSGLTTASGLWVSAAIGLAVGFGYYVLALVGTLMTLFIFTVLWHIERHISTYPDTTEQ